MRARLTRCTLESVTILRSFLGIGPGVENRLHAAGIITYQQLAVLSPEDIARILSDMVGFSIDRITQQDWIGQACHLVAELHDDNPTN